MPQINKLPVLGLFLLAGLFMLAGCGSSSNSPSTIDPAKEGHAAGWLPAGHMAAAQADLTSCSRCHGSDFSGGISQVSCIQCHLGNSQDVHPLDWDNLVGIRHAGYVKSNGNSACANMFCHGADLTGVPQSGPSCSSCHLGGPASVHPLDWGNFAYSKHPPYIAANGTAACANAVCHGPSLGGVADSGPSCTSCHLGGPASVHPLDWGTTSFLKHPAYVAANGTAACANAVCHGPSLGGVVDSGPACSTCHLDGATSVHPLEWGTLTYARHAGYVASNGTGACSNAQCHGPSLSGVAGSGPSCSSCHLGGPTAVHPADWNNNILQHAIYVGSKGTGSCSNVVCHGPTLQGVLLSGPSCSTCHKFPI